jgi:CHAD domain-containing protein
VGLALVDAARAAAARLDDPHDTEALHDFRVSLRRLRTLLRNFRPELAEAVPRKLQRRLRDLTRATGAGRDAEVQLAWVRDHRQDLGRRPGTGLSWFIGRLTERRDRAYAGLHDAVLPEFRQLERRVRRVLNRTGAEADARRSTYATAAARLIREHATELEQEVAAARSPGDEAAIHGARIAVKRLRYLLESLAADVPDATTLVAGLKELQDLLGELRDVHILIDELGDAIADAAAERGRRLHALTLRGRPRPAERPRRAAPGSAGPLALARLASETEVRLFQRLVAEWVEARLPALMRGLGSLADALPPLPPIPLPRSPRPLPIRYARRARP